MNTDYLYREELMDIYKNSTSKGHLDHPTVEVTEQNPVCGDQLTLQLQIEGNKIVDAKFDGMACAVSVISSSYLLKSLIGKTVTDAKLITKDQLLEMIGLNLTTSRIKCATLILEALHNAISKIEIKK